MPKHLLLIDSSGFAYRAYHGGSKWPRHREDGMPTGTVIGFLEMLWRLLGDAKADPVSHAAAVFDAPGLTFRHKILPNYKGNRKARDPELSLQLPVMRDAARALGLATVEVVNFEADDVIATLAHIAVLAGHRVTIVSSDKDFGQLVVDNKVEIVDPMKNKRVLAAQVREKFGVGPALVQDVQALAGDPVDNIDGVPGIGLDKAAKLIRKLGSLDAVIAEAAKKSGYRMSASEKLAIHRHRKDIPLWLAATTLRRNVKLPVTLDDLAARPPERAHLVELLKALEAQDKMRQIFGDAAAAPPPATAPVVLEFDWHARALVEADKKAKNSTHRIMLQAPAEPQSGWYRRRLIKDGPWVPARIWRQQDTDFMTDRPSDNFTMMCAVGDTVRKAVDQWNWLLNNPIPKAEYDYMMMRRDWAKRWAPTEPEANEESPVDWLKVPI